MICDQPAGEPETRRKDQGLICTLIGTADIPKRRGIERLQEGLGGGDWLPFHHRERDPAVQRTVLAVTEQFVEWQGFEAVFRIGSLVFQLKTTGQLTGILTRREMKRLAFQIDLN